MVRLIDGEIRKGMKIRLMSNNQVYEVDSVGALSPKMKELDQLSAGEVGFIIATIKVVADTKIGDTITGYQNPTAIPYPGFQEVKPMVFAGLYPVEPNQYEARPQKLPERFVLFTNRKWRSANAAAFLASPHKIIRAPGRVIITPRRCRSPDRWGDPGHAFPSQPILQIEADFMREFVGVILKLWEKRR
jgi:hypothetical protein